jgi:microcystin-dependent protein
MTVYPVQTGTFTLIGNGAVAGSTSIILQSFKDILGNNLTMASFGDKGYGTIEPNTSNEDAISFTGITQNSDGTATLTGVASTLFISPYTEGSGLRASHAGSVPFLITNTAAFTATYPNKNNVETITKNWAVPDPVGVTDIANKQWVLTVVNGGTVSVSNVVVGGTAGETFSTGALVYLKVSDGRWWKTSASTASTLDNVQLGIAQSAGSAGVAITAGVLTFGLYVTSGLTTNSLYYAADTAGAIAATTGTNTKVIGQSISTTQLMFNPEARVISTSNPLSFTGLIFPYAGSSAPTGFLLCDGSAVSRTAYPALFAVTSTTYGVGDGSTTFNLPDLRARAPIGIGAVTKVATFVSRSSNVITVNGLSNTSSNEFQTGQAVLYHAVTTVMTGLTNDTTYYIIRTGNLTFSLASSLANAIAGTAIALSSDGAGAQTFTLTLSTRTLGETGGEENHGLTQAETPAHTHGYGTDTGPQGSGSSTVIRGSAGSGFNTTSVGSSTSHNNMQPFLGINYIIKY